MHLSIKHTPLAAAMLLALNAPLYSPTLMAAPGDAIGGEIPVNTFTTNRQLNPSTAMDADGDFVITWTSYLQDGSSNGNYAQRYNADGTAASSEFPVNTFTTDRQQNPSIAMDADGDFVISWESRTQDGSNYSIYAQRYNADGTAAGSEFPVNTFTAGNQFHSSVAMDADGDFVITWESIFQDGDSYGIYAQRYNADGTAAGSEFPVNTVTSGSQRFASIALDADGDFVIAWQSDGQDGSNYGIYAQRFNADGTTAGAEFPVNTFTSERQRNSSIAMDADGDFVIAWQSYGQDGSSTGIYAQRYNADGTVIGGEMPVNTFTTSVQGSPSIAMDADGDFVIAWNSYLQDGSSEGIYAQRYNADGTAAGGEFPVNTITSNSQTLSSIALDADGDFVIAWQSNAQDGDSQGIYARRYAGAGNFAPGTVDLNLVVQDDTDPIVQGNNFVYSLITTNNGSGIAMDVNLSDPLPAGVSYVSNDGAGVGWNCSEVTGTVSCNKPFMTATEVNTINLTVSADTPSTVNNTVTVNAAQIDEDSLDNTDTESTVIADPDTTAPVITLLGDNPMILTKGTTFTDPGSTVSDNADTGLVATVTGSVDTSTLGTYTLSYNVSDSANNATTVTREVKVVTAAGNGIFGVGSMQGFFTLVLALPLWLRRRFKA